MADISPLYGLDAEWQKHGSCIDYEENLWLIWPEEDDGELTAEQIDALERGKKVCAGCSVRVECHDDDMLHGHPGTRGGVDEAQKLSIKRHRNRYSQYFNHDLREIKDQMRL